MANHQSAIKYHQQSLVRAMANKQRISRIKTFIKKTEALIVAGQSEEARLFFRKTESEIFKGVSKGVLKKNNAARKISRLAQKIKQACLATTTTVA